MVDTIRHLIHTVLKVLGTALFITAILTLLTPLVAVWNVNLLLALRIIMGVAEAVTFPSLPPLIQRLSSKIVFTKLQITKVTNI